MARASSDGTIDVSVVLPVFNERMNIQPELERIMSALNASVFSYEIIVVDDGSTDGSLEQIKSISVVRKLRLNRNRGTGEARKLGTQAARGRVVVWTDVDMTYPNDRIPELVHRLSGSDQIVGARDTEKGTARPLRSVAKWLIRRLASYLIQQPIDDLNSGLRAFRRDVALQFLHLLPSGFSCVTTMTMSFLSHGYTVAYMPIEYSQRGGKSKFHWWRDTKKYLLQVVRLILSYEPLRVFVPVGLTFFALAMGKLGYDWLARDYHLSTNTLLLFLVTFLTITVGFLADLVVRMTRQRNLLPASYLVEIEDREEEPLAFEARPGRQADSPILMHKGALD